MRFIDVPVKSLSLSLANIEAQGLLWENHMEDSEKYIKLHLLQSFHASFAAGLFSHGTRVGTASSAGSVWDSGAVEETPDLG